MNVRSDNGKMLSSVYGFDGSSSSTSSSSMSLPLTMFEEYLNKPQVEMSISSSTSSSSSSVSTGSYKVILTEMKSIPTDYSSSSHSPSTLSSFPLSSPLNMIFDSSPCVGESSCSMLVVIPVVRFLQSVTSISSGNSVNKNVKSRSLSHSQPHSPLELNPKMEANLNVKVIVNVWK